MIGFILVLSLVLSVYACGDDDDDDDDSADDDDDGPTGGGAEETWTDPDTNLTWLLEFDQWIGWDDATAYCENSTLGGHDDWSLPSIDQLRTLVSGCDNTGTGGECGVTSDCLTEDCWTDVCEGCEAYKGSYDDGFYIPDLFLHDECIFYWSSSVLASDSGEAVYLQPHDALIDWTAKWVIDATCVTCVR